MYGSQRYLYVMMGNGAVSFGGCIADTNYWVNGIATYNNCTAAGPLITNNMWFYYYYGTSRLCFSIHQSINAADSGILQSVSDRINAQGNAFNATQVLIATWVQVTRSQQVSSTIEMKQQMTVQVAIASDDLRTYAIFNYPSGMMDWTDVTVTNTDSMFAGFYINDAYCEKFANWLSTVSTYWYYSTVNGTYQSGLEESTTGHYLFNLSAQVGNTGLNGSWYFSIGADPSLWNQSNCSAGFYMSPITNACADMDECSLQTGLCSAALHRICVNTVGSFRCDCASFYKENANTSLCESTL
jgi:hypothetical protein